MLRDGQYLLTVKAQGFKELNEVIQIGQELAPEYKFVMKKLNEGFNALNVFVFDLISGKPVQNVYLEFIKESFQKADEEVSDQ